MYYLSLAANLKFLLVTNEINKSRIHSGVWRDVATTTASADKVKSDPLRTFGKTKTDIQLAARLAVCP